MGWVVGPLWFDTALRGLRAGSPRTGWATAWVRGGRLGWVGCWGLCGSTRPSEDSRSAHHERGRGSAGARKTGGSQTRHYEGLDADGEGVRGWVGW